AASTVCFTVTEFVGKQVTDMTGASTTAGATGSLYAMVEESTGYELWRIDIGPGSCPSTYTATPPISNTGVTDIWGIAYDPDGKFSGGKPVVYAVALHGGMYEIDTVSGTAYSIGCAGDCGVDTFNSLAMDTDGTMFTGNNILVNVDARTHPANFTSIGSIGAGEYLSALAMVKLTGELTPLAS